MVSVNDGGLRTHLVIYRYGRSVIIVRRTSLAACQPRSSLRYFGVALVALLGSTSITRAEDAARTLSATSGSRQASQQVTKGLSSGTGVVGFLPLLTAETFDPYTDDGQDPAGFHADKDEFYTFRGPRYGVNHPGGHDEDEGKSPTDNDAVFRFTESGDLHILGNKNRGQHEPFGYISTEDAYRNYHLSLEYRWGKERFIPRSRVKRDSGLLYHMVGPDVVWTTDVETQIQEGDTGDFYFLGEPPDIAPGALRSSGGTVAVDPGGEFYKAGGELVDTDQSLTKSHTVDSLTDWNRVEVIVDRDNVTVIVNGEVVNRATNLRRSEAGIVIPLKEGKIALQAEGAEIYYRDVEIKPLHAVGGLGPFRVLIYQDARGKANSDVVNAARTAIERLGASNGFEVDVTTEPSGSFTEEKLQRYAAVVWNGVNGDALTQQERTAFEQYVQAGGGCVTLRGAAAKGSWDWFARIVAAELVETTESALATLHLDPEAYTDSGGAELCHPAADALPAEWRRVDHWPRFKTNPRADVNVLLNLQDEADGSDRPIAWWHDEDAGRTFYSGLGYQASTYTEPLYLMHLLGGIEYAAGVSRVPPRDAFILFDGVSTSAFERMPDGSLAGWQIDDEASLVIVPGSGSIRTKQAFTDYRLHLEFTVAPYASGTPEQQRSNSGIYLHGSYELQVLDSYRDEAFGDQHAGAIYGVRQANVNASLPAAVWQVYDVDFTAPQFDQDGKKLASARITAYLNGVLIHESIEVPGPTRGGLSERPGPQPLWLQDHDPKSRVRYRNIWLQPSGA